MKKVFAVFLALTVLFSLAAVAAAAGTPSIENQPIENVPVDGEHDAIITHEDGTQEFINPGDELEIVVTPIADAENAIVQEIKDKLEAAGEQIEQANTVAQLLPEVIPTLEQFKNESTDPNAQNLKVEDLIIADVFDASLVLNGITYVESPDGSRITFAVQTDLKPGDDLVLFLMENVDGSIWNMVTDYELTPDGVLIITVDKLGVFAIIIGNAGALPLEPNGPRSPQTGYGLSDFLWLGAAICGALTVLAAGYGFAGRKKEEQ